MSTAKRLWDKGADINALIHDFTVDSDPELDKELLPFDILASAAHARMLESIDVLKEEELGSLLAELSKLYPKACDFQIEIPRELEDCHTALENILTEKLGDTGKKIHTGRSRNDQVLVASRLFLRDRLLTLLEDVQIFAEQCLALGGKFGHVLLPGHTHFQPAMPQSAKMWFQAFAEDGLMLLRKGLALFDELNCNPLGAASGFGVPLPLDREMTARLLCFNRVQRNPVHVQNSRGRYEGMLLDFASEIAGTLEKMAWDLIWLSSSELGYIKLPVEFTTGSSIMPQKRNPDVLELLRASASRVRAARDENLQICAKLPSNYHRDLQFGKASLFRGLESLTTMLKVSNELLPGIDFDRERAEQALSAEVLVTYEAYRMVKEGLPFRDAYLEAAERLQRSELDVSELKKEFSDIGLCLDVEGSAAEQDLHVLKSDLQEKDHSIKPTLNVLEAGQ